MKQKHPNRPPIPWAAIRSLVSYLKRPNKDRHPEHINEAIRTVAEWLNPGKPKPDPRQLSIF